MSTTKLMVATAVVLGLGGLGVAVFQSGEARRATHALAATEQQRETTRAQLTALEKRARRAEEDNVAANQRITALEKQLAAAQQNPPTAARATASVPPAAERTSATMDATTVQAEKAKLHQRYDPLLLQRGFTAEQMERFIELMWQKDRVREDVQAAVAQHGAKGDDPGVTALRAKLDGPIWQEIRQMLGEDGMAAFSEHEKTSSVRMGYIDPIRPTLANANNPLTDDQASKLVGIILANTTYQRTNPSSLGTQRQLNFDAIVAEAETVLTPAQLPVFKANMNRWKSVMK